MKIGILTFHRSINNGAVIQSYSLSKRIKEDFPEDTVEIIDYHMPMIQETYNFSLKNYFKSASLVNFLKKTIGLIFNPRMPMQTAKKIRSFENAFEKLPLTVEKIYDDKFNKLFDYINAEFDILIVGSDAVWNFTLRGFPNAYFPDKTVTCQKLSYAASCYGMDFFNISDDIRLKIGDILNNFDFIGVRDKATEDFVKWSGCCIEPVHTCDPTAFLDLEKLPINIELLKKKLSAKGFDFNKPTIGVMGSMRMVKMIKGFYGNKYQIAALYNYTKGADVQLFDLDPFEWAYVFRFFKITFTTYFHGTMLSLKNGVPVICIALDTQFSKRHIPKTLDLLTRLKYDSWYFKTDYISQNFDEIKNKSDELLSNSHKNDILKRVNEESESYNYFKSALIKCRKERNTDHNNLKRENND